MRFTTVVPVLFFLCSLALAADFAPLPTTKILSGVPIMQQTTSFSCGPAAMVSVYAYYGIDTTEETLMREMASDPNKGTDHHKMAEHATKLGLKARIGHNLTLQDIADSIARNQPVVIEAQAWRDTNSSPVKAWAERWDDGHYMVVIGIDDKFVYFVDPSLPGHYGYIATPEFLDRWHDLGWNNEKLYRTAIFFDGTPKPIPTWLPVQ